MVSIKTVLLLPTRVSGILRRSDVLKCSKLWKRLEIFFYSIKNVVYFCFAQSHQSCLPGLKVLTINKPGSRQPMAVAWHRKSIPPAMLTRLSALGLRSLPWRSESKTDFHPNSLQVTATGSPNARSRPTGKSWLWNINESNRVRINLEPSWSWWETYSRRGNVWAAVAVVDSLDLGRYWKV